MRLQTRVKGYTVKGRDRLGYFTSGLYETPAKVRETYEFMMKSAQYDEKTKKSFTIIKVVETEEKFNPYQ